MKQAKIFRKTVAACLALSLSLSAGTAIFAESQSAQPVQAAAAVAKAPSLASLIKIANAALKAVPTADKITVKTLKAAKVKVTAAEKAITAAIAKGAAEDGSDFNETYYANYQDALDQIEELETAKTEAIEAATAALEDVPSYKEITNENLEDAKTAVEAAEKAVKDAKAAGAEDKDFNKSKLSNLASAKKQIDKLVKEKATAIKVADVALKAVPKPEKITLKTLTDAKKKVAAAEKAITAAIAKGAAEDGSEFNETYYNNFQDAIDAITELEAEKVEAIETANAALEEIQDAAEITNENVEDARDLVAKAKDAIKEAKAEGAVDKDFDKDGLAKLVAAEKKIAKIDTANALAVKKVLSKIQQLAGKDAIITSKGTTITATVSSKAKNKTLVEVITVDLLQDKDLIPTSVTIGEQTIEIDLEDPFAVAEDFKSALSTIFGDKDPAEITLGDLKGDSISVVADGITIVLTAK